MTLATILFVAFALLSGAGALWAGTHFRGRATGVGLALAVLVFFALLFAALLWLLRTSGAS